MSTLLDQPLPLSDPLDVEAERDLQARIEQRKRERREVGEARDAQVRALYPYCRTFALVIADPIGPEQDAATAKAALPTSLTLVTPDHDDPSKDHLYVGPYPVLSRHLHYDKAFEDLTFETSDGEHPIRGHLRLLRSRTRAHGSLSFGGHSFAVEYEVKPQRYELKLGRGAAYLAGSSAAPQVKWDTESERWKQAPWSSDYVADFTYGVTGSQVIGDQVVYDFVATFADRVTGKTWVPFDGDYIGVINKNNVLKFAVQAAVTPPRSGTDGSVFPYLLQCQLSPFAYDFVGGMLCDRPDLAGTVYGIQGVWAGTQVAGTYLLDSARQTDGPSSRPALLSVHDGLLHVGATSVATTWEGNTLHWSGLASDALPESGHLEFAADGHTISGSSLGCSGWRVHPDAAAQVTSLPDAYPDDVALYVAAKPRVATHDINELLAMSQFSRTDGGNYYDKIQSESMTDFYAILQYYMDPDIRKQFFNPNPPPLDPGLYGIAHTEGKKDKTKPDEWYRGLSVAYTCTVLPKWSSDPGAALLNAKRASAWITNQTGIADVMTTQAPLLYARRYQQKYESLDWFLADQKTNAGTYKAAIDAKADDWIAEIRANFTGKAADLQKVVDSVIAMRDRANADKLFWAFTVFAYTSRPAYLNMLQTIMIGGDEIDGSEFSQRVQRTVALLNILDPSGYFSSEYAYILQLFQVSTVLPQLTDFSGDVKDFSLVVKLILDKFIETYIDSQDPKMREAAEQLRKHASQDLVRDVLQVLRQSAAAAGAVYNWTNLVATFESRVAKLFGALPGIVSKMIMMGAAGLLISYFVTGQVNWSDLDPEQQLGIIAASAGIVAQVTLMVTTRLVAFGQVFNPGNGLWKNFKLFFSPSLLEKAQAVGAQGFKGFLLGSRGLDQQAQWLSRRANLALRFGQAAEAAALQARADRLTMLQKIFGRNMNEFLATRLGAAMAAVGIVMSAYLLAQGGEPLEVAANSLFLAASILEFIAAAGLWATQAFGVVAIGGIAVGTIFAVVSVVAIIAFIAGAVLIAVLLFRPQDSPVTKFAKEKAGVYYMPQKTDIDNFEVFQQGSQPQRSGIRIAPSGRGDACLYVDGDGTLAQRPFDATGHTALYLNVDEFGRAQFGAPLVDEKGAATMLVLALDQQGALVATKATETTTTTRSMMWTAEIQGPGTNDGEYLLSATFRLYNVGWYETKKVKRYITAAAGGWVAADSTGTDLVLTMVTAKPQNLTMANIVWNTLQHDQRQAPALGIPGSGPRSWSLSPALPEGLIFSAETGEVGMEIGVNVPATPSATYTLTVTNAVGSASTTFTITVEEQKLAEEPRTLAMA